MSLTSSNPVRGICAETRVSRGIAWLRCHETRLFPLSAPYYFRCCLLALVLFVGLVLVLPPLASAHTVKRGACISKAKQGAGRHHVFVKRFRRCKAGASRHGLRHAWQGVARCESGGHWKYNGSSGFDGGLQFHPGTWTAYKRGITRKRYAYQARPHQQRLVAERVRRGQGIGAWPHCGKFYRGWRKW